MNVTAELLTKAKNYLDITWTDESADAKLSGQLSRGMTYLMDKTGAEASDFEVDGRDQELLFNYVLYDRAGSVDQFKQNYLSDIIGLRMKREVEHATQSEG